MLIASPVLAIVAGCGGSKGPPTAGKGCASNGPVTACVEVVEDNGQVSAYGWFDNGGSYNVPLKHWDYPDRAMEIESMDIAGCEPGQSAQQQFDDHSQAWQSVNQMTAQSNWCDATGRTVQATISGSFYDDGQWYPLEATSFRVRIAPDGDMSVADSLSR